ncbi:Myo-inositol 2-dehydrogenase 1 [hydrothermal vent metagenome]|uniref:Myo-inositol 2-dehydrogenase 1 n=1 Tax=hydrothermal vent metagenome TaxID=652676 RepID=A0A3B1D3M9_9ZZZZ
MEKKKQNNFNRRDFIKTSAAVGAGLIVAPWVKTSGRDSISNDINVALLGAGAEGQVLMNACLKIPNIKFKAVCDIWEDYNLKRAYRLLKKYGHELNPYIDYKEMLAKEKDLDAIIVATPDFWHARHAIASMNAGLHVYCEKEMSNTLEGVRQIVNAQKRTGRIVQIGHQRRSNPYYIHSYYNLIKEAKILGRMTTINGQWNRSVQADNGWPKKYEIPVPILKKYGFKNMEQFRNWRWYRGLGGGPIVDLGSHQIDIYNWFVGTPPYSVMASGGTDYYDKKTHEWYDTVLAIFKYKTDHGIVRAFYQTITTNSNQGYFETFMGDQGALTISESAGRVGVFKEASAPPWDKWVDKGYLNAPEESEKKENTSAVLDVRETAAPPKYTLPIQFNDPYHKPHLENFFNTIRGEDTLNCPVEVGYETAVAVLKVNEAIKAKREVKYNPNAFIV